MLLCKLHNVFPLCGGVGFGLGGECGVVIPIVVMLARIQLENETFHHTTQQDQTEFFVFERGLVGDGCYGGEAVGSVIGTRVAGVYCVGGHGRFGKVGQLLGIDNMGISEQCSCGL